MAATIKELAITGPFGGDHCERAYSIEYEAGDTPTDALAFAALIAAAPARWLGTDLDTYASEVTPVSGRPLMWTGRAVYKRTTPQQVFDEISEDVGSMRGSTRGGRQHITQSIATTGYGSAPDEGGAIGFDGEKVQGVEIEIGASEWCITKRVTAANHETFFQLCDEATGYVNSAIFKGHAIGTVKFLGADFEGRAATTTENATSDDYIYTLYYAYKRTQTVTLILSGTSTAITVVGWDVLDVRYADVADASTKDILRKARYAYVHQVYPRGSLPE